MTHIIKRRVWPRLIFKAIAALALALLFQFSPTGISASYASKLDDCLHSLGDAANLAKTLEQDLPGIAACAGQVAGGDVVAAAVTVILAAYAAANGGFGGSGGQVNQCNQMVDQLLITQLVAGLRDIYQAGDVGKSAIDALFAGDDNAMIIFNDLSSSQGASTLVSAISQIPGVDQLMSEISCGCSIIGGAIDIGEATVQLGADGAACAAVIGDFLVDAGKAVGGGFEDVGNFVECDFPGANCGFQGQSFENNVYGACGAGPQIVTEHSETDVDQVHGTVVKKWRAADCSCPAGTSVRFQDGNSYDTANYISCVCNQAGEGYENDGACHSCVPSPGHGVDMYGSCTSFTCPQVAGMVATPDTPTEIGAWGQCEYHHACADGTVLGADGACQACPANQVAEYADATGSQGYYSGGAWSAGHCAACPSGTQSDPGSMKCVPVSCPVDQRMSADGHSCVACDKVGPYLDAPAVCEDSSGTPLKQPTECDSGTAMTLDGKSYPAAYNQDDCKPVVCTGLDHLDGTGHACMACQDVAHIPLSVFGVKDSGQVAVTSREGGGASATSTSGKSYSVGNFRVVNGNAQVELTNSAGNSQLIALGANKGGNTTVAMCMDGVFKSKPLDGISFGPMSIPGIQVNRAKPDVTYRQTTPLNGDLGKSLVTPDLNRSGLGNQQMPMSTKLPPGSIPRPNGAGASLPTQSGRGPSSARPPARDDGPKGITPPAEGDKSRGQSLPAHGDYVPAKQAPKNAGKLTTKTSGHEKLKKKDGGDGAYGVTLPARGNKSSGKSLPARGDYVPAKQAQKKAGKLTARTSRRTKFRKDGGGGAYGVTLPAHGNDDSGKTRPSLSGSATMRAAPTLHQRIAPTLNNNTRAFPSFTTPLSPFPSTTSAPPKIH